MPPLPSYLFLTYTRIIILPICISVHHVHIWYLWRPEEGFKFPGTGVTGSYDPPLWVLGLNLGSLEEQPVVLTAELPLLPTFKTNKQTGSYYLGGLELTK